MSSIPSLPQRAGYGEGGAGNASVSPSPGPSGLGRTRRERLRELLLSTDEGVSLEQIEKIFEVKRQIAISDLEHLRLSLRHKEEKLLMVPPACGECGFTFRLEVPKAPSKCPKCKSRDLTDPIFKASAEA